MWIRLRSQGGRKCSPLCCHPLLRKVEDNSCSALFSASERQLRRRESRGRGNLWLRKAPSSVMSFSPEKLHEWARHYFKSHCYFFSQGTALAPRLPASLKHIQSILDLCLGLALETLSACPPPLQFYSHLLRGGGHSTSDAGTSCDHLSLHVTSPPRGLFKVLVTFCKRRE